MPNIAAALALLDKENPDHWTADGSPRVDVVQHLLGNTQTVTRKMITDAEPQFNRESRPDVASDEPDPPAEPTAPVADEVSANTAPVVEASPPTPTETPAVEDVVYILDMPLAEVFASETLLVAFQAEANAQHVIWLKEKKALEDRIAHISKWSAKADAQLGRMDHGRIGQDAANIRRFQDSMKKVREERAARVKEFIASGIDRGMLVNALSGKSQLDQVLNQRKPKAGSTRPNPRMPVRGQRGA